MQQYYQKIKSPIGELHLVANDKALMYLGFKNLGWDAVKKSNPIIELTKTQLQEYFEGKRKKFDVPFSLAGTEFQNTVWNTLAKIPFGKTWSYQQMAEAVKKPAAMRAVGRTNGLNPISIILPCHRVIGKSGSLTGYAGGLPAKEFLLRLEGLTPQK
ncbi:methylated-DNA--[protein]-cysteine S-methyltransferase [Peredibacter starrii]|uniref:Methylated-DNA--protein-cysteine methyltransferase n=1 Tax=Peredibacter starrii TaxID=28202 RepID=A0AAX4HPC8_9BACT|nr:methylated-DNA--[protein]-cysteine S-methyltransferase [Peredibacter starrii]WPU65185.1 methylated-DNA--[protein]-cysteine S-methyltransferase [Peredibacter starrii]